MRLFGLEITTSRAIGNRLLTAYHAGMEDGASTVEGVEAELTTAWSTLERVIEQRDDLQREIRLANDALHFACQSQEAQRVEIDELNDIIRELAEQACDCADGNR